MSHMGMGKRCTHESQIAVAGTAAQGIAYFAEPRAAIRLIATLITKPESAIFAVYRTVNINIAAVFPEVCSRKGSTPKTMSFELPNSKAARTSELAAKARSLFRGFNLRSKALATRAQFLIDM